MAASVLHLPLIAQAAESPPAGAAPAAPAPAPAPAPVKVFPILEYRVEGNTVLRSVDVERASRKQSVEMGFFDAVFFDGPWRIRGTVGE